MHLEHSSAKLYPVFKIWTLKFRRSMLWVITQPLMPSFFNFWTYLPSVRGPRFLGRSRIPSGPRKMVKMIIKTLFIQNFVMTHGTFVKSFSVPLWNRKLPDFSIIMNIWGLLRRQHEKSASINRFRSQNFGGPSLGYSATFLPWKEWRVDLSTGFAGVRNADSFEKLLGSRRTHEKRWKVEEYPRPPKLA